MGTGPFAVPTASKLLADGHEIPLVVTRPLVDPNAKKLPPRPVFDWATQAGIPIFEPASINTPEAIEELRSYAAELFFVCDYGQILSNECLGAAKLGGINLHGSLLPRHRGAAPVQWALLRGDTEAGVTVIHMTPRLDAGPALSVATTEILPDETAEGLEPRLAQIGVAATVQSIDLLSRWDGTSDLGTVQDKSLVTRAPRFAKSDGQLDFRLPAEYLVRLVRACQPWPGTFAELEINGGKAVRIIVRAARALPSSLSDSRILAGAQPGDAIAVTAAELGLDWTGVWEALIAVQTTNGIVLIARVQPAGKREMDASEFNRGHKIGAGSRFRLPEPAKLELS